METQKNDNIESSLKELNEQLEQTKKDLIQELNNVNDCEVCMEPNKKMSDVIGDIFYKSMKNLFDVGNKLAKSLTSEILPENRKK
jgi:hypothetical protein